MIGEAPSGDEYWGYKIGCMPCVGALEVGATNDGYDALMSEVGGMPIHPVGVGGSERASCGLGAINGNCPNKEMLELLGDLIDDGSIPGVALRTEG